MERQHSARHAVTSRTIEESAVRLVLEHGLDAVTVDMICEASGISQRTFFNHFPTKLAAIVGSHMPRIDEDAVRRFLASDSPDVLSDVLDLAARLAPGDTDPRLAAERWTLVTRTPALMQVAMERLLAVQGEMADVLVLRLKRHAGPDESDDDLRAQAGLLSHLVAGIMRFSIEGDWRTTGPQPPNLDRARVILAQLLPKLGG